MQKKSTPYILIVLFAFVLSFSYFSPLLQNKRIIGTDLKTAIGKQHEIHQFKNETGHNTSWTNSIFSGMPTYSIWIKLNKNLIRNLRKIEKIAPYPASMFIILILGAYFCLILFGVNPWVGIIGALAYAMASHFYILTATGHITKLWALTYAVPLIASVYITFKGKYLWGSLLTAVFLAIEISTVHPQINYYVLVFLVLFGIVWIIFAIKEKTIKQLILPVFLIIVAVIFAVGANANYLLPTKEYTQYSTRGKNALTDDNKKVKVGLDKDYILDYSYDWSEALTAFIPRLKGGSNAESLNENYELYKQLVKVQGKSQARKTIQHMPMYWGSQPIVAGPFYFGAIICFLFVLGLFIVKGKEKWWLVSVVIVSFLLSQGKYMYGLNSFLIDHLPLYNKFRDVKNIVFIQYIAMWLLGMLALNNIVKRKTEKAYLLKSLKFSVIITGSIALFLVLFPGIAGNFSSANDARYFPGQLLDALKSDRIRMARLDAFRTLVFVLISALLLHLFIKEKIKGIVALAIGLILFLSDMWPIDKRYLNNDNFVSKRKAEVPFTPSKADLDILKDKSLDYRVLNLTVNPWSDASTSYFHKSIGGYHGAKMGRYQDMIEHHLSPEVQQLTSRLRNVKSQADIDSLFIGLNGINMLNTKYIIYNPKARPLVNIYAFGNAWFVHNYKVVADANAEIDEVGKIDVAETAVVDQRFKNQLPAEFTNDSTATIQLQSYAPNKLVYNTSSGTKQLAVFSEVYYPKGWIVTIDGKEASHFRADYILRAMVVPAGKHEIVFKFEPKSYEIGNKISFASSLIMLLAIAGTVFVEIKKKMNKK